MKEYRIPLRNLIGAFSDTIDLVNMFVQRHHQRTSAIAYGIASQMGLSGQELIDCVAAAAVHDVGALSVSDRLNTLGFEIHPGNRHAALGSALLENFVCCPGVSRIVLHHHARWDDRNGGNHVPTSSWVLHLADRVDVLINPKKSPLQQAQKIRQQIAAESGKMFHPDVVGAFMDASSREHFWFDIVHLPVASVMEYAGSDAALSVTVKELETLSTVFSRIIDFRSRFTATHSTGVAHVAEALSRMLGFSESDVVQMRIAGRLHDIGKLAVPTELLEKPGALTPKEFDIMKSHSYHTWRILRSLRGIETVASWAALHHERLGGTGYPFRLTGSELLLGSQVMAVADIFVALCEDRPYRKGMQPAQVKEILSTLHENGELLGDAVEVLLSSYDRLNALRAEVQHEAQAEYERFMAIA